MKLFTLSLEDGTPPSPGFQPALGAVLRREYHEPDPHRPPLLDVLTWLDSQADFVRAATASMRRNPGTTTIFLHARLPIFTDAFGCHRHGWITRIAVDGTEMDVLKARVTANYQPGP